MNKIVYKLSRELAVIITIVISCMLWTQSEFIRLFMNLVLSLCFLFVSMLYEKKWGTITPGYVFLFVIMFIDNTVCAAYYTDQTTAKLTSKWLGDYYLLYFFVTLIVFLVVIAYLLGTKQLLSQNNKYEKGYHKSFAITYKRADVGVDCITVLLMLLLHYSGLFDEVFIPLYIFLALRIILEKEKRIIYIVILGLLIPIFGKSVFEMRYEFIQIVLPILFFFLCTTKRRIGFLKANIYMIIAFAMLMLYGIVSEVYKLDNYFGSSYDLWYVLTHQAFEFMGRQIFRLFGIWIKLGGYIIYHVQKNGLFYGLTYIKSLSGVLGFRYISLPVISAAYNGSTYAQPGLLAEGYANFGIIGAVLNLCIIFFFMEYVARRFVKKPTLFTFVIAFVPFTKVFLDGGTLNSAIYILVLCLLMFAPDYFLKKRRSIAIYETKNFADAR